MKKFIALVLSLIMALSLCAPAWAAEPVTTEDELRSALSVGGDVVLGAEITVTSTLTVAKNTSVVLNLNGHNLSYTVDNNGKASAIIINNGTLEIEGNGTISFKATDPDVDYSPEGFPTYATNTITNEGTLTIGEGVVIANGSDGGASYAVDNKGSFTMNGGKLVGNRCALRVAKYNQDNVYFEMNGGIITALTPGWIQLPGGDGNVAPTITVEINGGVMQTTKTSSMENNLFYTYSHGNSHANTKITVNGGEFLGGVVSIGSGYTGDAPTLTITGGTFEYDVLKWTSDSSEVLYTATDAVFVHTPGELPAVEDGDIIIVTADGTYSAAIDKAISFTVQPGGIATNVDLEITPATGYDMTTQEVDNGIKYTFVPLAAKVGDTYYKTLQAAVDAVADKGTIAVVVAGETAVVNTAKSFTVTGEAATIKAGVGFLLSEKDGVYTVTEYKAPEVVEPETEVTVDVADPVMIPNPELTVEEKAIADEVTVSEICTEAMAEVVEKIAEVEVTVSNEQLTDLSETMEETVTADEVVVVVQTNFEVKVEAVSVEGDKTTVTLDITPVYQHVATTKDVVESGAKIEVGENAVALSDEKSELDLKGKEVEITIAIPDVLVDLAVDKDGKKVLYVNHTKDDEVKTTFVYEAEVNVTEKTATFFNPNGFSSFTISATNSIVAEEVESGMKYADLKSAITNAGKGAVIEVKVSGLEADITAPCSFKLKWADNITEPTFNVAKGYTMSKWYVNGVYTYIVQSASAGGYAPSTTPEKVVTSADTFDAGIALYVGMSVMAAAGSAVVLKKRED